MKKKLIKDCDDCENYGCDKEFKDCPLPDEPEKVRGKIYIEVYPGSKFDWCIDLWIDLDNVTIESQNMFETKDEAKQDALEWAKKLNVEVTE